MVKEDLQKKCLHHLIMELLEPGMGTESRNYRNKITDWIDKDILKPRINWNIDKQEVLTELIFENDELMSAIRNQYLKYSELYIELEKRYQEYLESKKEE